MAAAAAAVVLSGSSYGRGGVPMTEVVVTLKAPPLSRFGRSLLSARHASYLRQMASAQASLTGRIESKLPGAQVRWRYRLVADGLAVVLPRVEVSSLAHVEGVAEVWPSVTYHSLAAKDGVTQIGANELWGPNFETAGNGMKIGIVDDGLDASNPYFAPSGFTYPAGFPKGQTQYTTPKVIVQRAFPAPGVGYKNAGLPFDPANSFHATHVAGIAAGDYNTTAGTVKITGVAPNAYLGNYKVLTTPTPDFGLDGNSAEIAAGIEAAVADGMNVINLSLGEPEVEPSRDLVVKAIDGAAAAGVVPVIAAGNDFDDFGFGTVNSPGTAPDAITVAAVNARDQIADFSSAGPTPVSLQMKPDVAAPGVDILSSLPTSQGTFGLLSGTSMAAPHVSGAAALLKERHPTWTVEQIKSALEQSGDPVHETSGAEQPPTREGGGVIDLVRADNPLVFATPTGLSFGRLAPGGAATRTIDLSDAGGGAGDWAVTASTGATAPPTVTVPGTLTVTATAPQTTGDTSGFVVLTRGADTRRIPFFFETSAPKLASEPKIALTKPGVVKGTTVGGTSRVSLYRYPTGGDRRYGGPERVYRIRVPASAANAGLAVVSGKAFPHVTFDGSEDRLAGYTALPIDLNPYRRSYGAPRRIAGVLLPAAGTYDLVLDSIARGGPFTFRWWVNDVTPPRLRIRSLKGGITVSATDAGSGVDPDSILALIDGKPTFSTFAKGLLHVRAGKGRHALELTVSDYQEAKNTENVVPVLPNTTTLSASVVVR